LPAANATGLCPNGVGGATKLAGIGTQFVQPTSGVFFETSFNGMPFPIQSLHKDDSLTSLQECGQMFDIFNSTQPPTVLMFVPKKWFVDQCSPAMIGQKFEGGDSDSDIEPNDGDEEEK
jgi:hypothetical protein